MKYNKLNIFLSTLNFAMIFVGYQFTTSLFLPISSDIEGISRTVTVPYRAFALLISLIVVTLNMKKHVNKLPFAVNVFWIYWFALIIRIFYDTNLRTNVYINDTNRLWFYILGIILPTTYSVIKSHKKIDLNKALKWVYLGIILTMILSLFNNSALLMDSSEITGRAGANIALKTITFGHLGTMGVVLSMFLFLKQNGLIKKIFFIVVMLLSFFIMLRSGSRSPILALVVIIVLWMFAKAKNMILGVSIVALAIVLMFVFMEPILNLMGNISPVIEYRLRAGIYEGDSSGRDPLYDQAFNLFLDKPLTGSQFALFNYFGEIVYSHNIILDALMALGFFGGLAIIYLLCVAIKKSYLMIKIKDSHFWIALILIQQIVLSMFSGALYYNQTLNVLLVFVIVYANKYNKVDKGLHSI